MKSVILLSAFAAISVQGFAQKQWVSVGLNGFGGSKSETESQTGGKAKSTSLNVFPTVGYNRFIGKDWGLGLKLGYKSFTNKSDDFYQTLTGEGYRSNYNQSEKTYVAIPSLFQNYAWKKFRGIASLSIPIELRTDITFESTNTSTTTTPIPASSEIREIRTMPDQFSIGVFANLAVQRQIVGGLYAGPEISFGIGRQSSKGTSTSTVTTGAINGPKQQTIQSSEGKYVQSYFTFSPALQLCYYF
jgi:hypothetical protein